MGSDSMEDVQVWVLVLVNERQDLVQSDHSYHHVLVSSQHHGETQLSVYQCHADAQAAFRRWSRWGVNAVCHNDALQGWMCREVCGTGSGGR